MNTLCLAGGTAIVSAGGAGGLAPPSLILFVFVLLPRALLHTSTGSLVRPQGWGVLRLASRFCRPSPAAQCSQEGRQPPHGAGQLVGGPAGTH